MPTETTTLLTALRAALRAAGYAESVPPEGPMPRPARADFWPYGWLESEHNGEVWIGLWNQVWAYAQTDATLIRDFAQLGEYRATLEAAGYTVVLHEATGERPWLVVTAPATGPSGGS